MAITPAAGYAKQPWSDGLLYTLKGGTGQGAPVLVVTSTVGESRIDRSERRAAARERFRALPGKPVAESERRVKICGVPGWEITGTGRQDGRLVSGYLAMVFTDGDAVIAGGSFDAAQYDGQMDAMRLDGAPLRVPVTTQTRG